MMRMPKQSAILFAVRFVDAASTANSGTKTTPGHDNRHEQAKPKV